MYNLYNRLISDITLGIFHFVCFLKISQKSWLIIVQQLVLIALVIFQLISINQNALENEFSMEVQNFEEVGKTIPVHKRMMQMVSHCLT